MIVGVGVDAVNIARFAATLERSPGLLARVFVPAERDLPVVSLAARFAAKEALAKALSTPRHLRWHDAEVVSAPSGAPSFVLRGTVAARAAELGIRSTWLSLSHDDPMAVAMVVAEG